MKNRVFRLTTILCAVTCLAFCVPAFAKDKVIEGLNSPESVARVGKYLYVSNVGVKLAPNTKDGDGYIAKLDLDGNAVKKDFITGLDAPKGLVEMGNVLYVADIDHLFGFDLKNGEKVFALDLSAEKTVFLNDLAIEDNDHLFISATDINKIFQVDIKTKTYRDVGVTVSGPNGLWYDAKGKYLYVVGFANQNGKASGEVGVVDLSRQPAEYQKIIDRPGFYDGLQPMSEGVFLVSDWVAFEPERGVLIRVNVKNRTFEVIPGAYGGPADFLYFRDKAGLYPPLLYIPRMIDGKLEIRTLK